MNRLVFRVHLWTGLASGALLLVVSLTGVLLLFAHDLDRALFPERYQVEPLAQRASFDAMAQAAREAYPGTQVRGFRLLPLVEGEAFTLDALREGQRRFIYVDPYRARVLTESDPKGTLEGFVLYVHYSLLAGRVGEALVLLLGVALVLSTLSGAWVYRKSLLKVFTQPVRWRGGARAWSADVHHWVGVTSLAFNLLLGATGVIMLWPLVVGRLSGESASAAAPARPFTGSVDEALARARAALPELRVRGVLLPRRAGDAVLVYGAVPGSPLLGATSSQVALEPEGLGVREVTDARALPLARQLALAVLPLHFGNWGGLPVRLLYALLGLAPGVLSLTGALLWWRKRRGVARPERARDPSGWRTWPVWRRLARALPGRVDARL